MGTYFYRLGLGNPPSFAARHILAPHSGHCPFLCNYHGSMVPGIPVDDIGFSTVTLNTNCLELVWTTRLTDKESTFISILSFLENTAIF